MATRRILQLAMVLGAATVIALVAVNWRSESERPPPAVEGIELPEGGGSGKVLSSSEDLDYTQYEDGVGVYTIKADRLVTYEGGRSEWVGGIELLLYHPPEQEGAEPKQTVISGQDRMVTLQVGNEVTEVGFEGNVLIRLPDGAELEAGLRPGGEQTLGYREADGAVVSDAGVELRYAGLVIQGRSMSYETRSRRLAIWGGPRPHTNRMVLSTDPEVPDAVPIGGTARSLSYQDDGQGVLLEGVPEVEMTDAVMAGTRIMLEVDRDTGRVRGVEAEGDARVVWDAAAGEHALEADRLLIEFGNDDRPRWIRSCLPLGPTDTGRTEGGRGSDAAEPTAAGGFSPGRPCIPPGSSGGGGRSPTLVLGGAGTLVAKDIALELLGGGRGTVRSSGAVVLAVDDATLGLESLETARLELGLGQDGLERAEAEGGVAAVLGNGAAGGRLSGERLSLTWSEGSLAGGEWSEGVRYQGTDATLVAAHGTFDGGDWIMDGTPRPRIEGSLYEVEADTARLTAAGGLVASGAVTATLSGAELAAVSAMLGGAESVNARASTLRVQGEDLQFGGGVSLWQGDRLLEADAIRLIPGGRSMMATGGVFLTLTRASVAPGQPGDPTAGGSVAQFELSGDQLLLEGDPPVLWVAPNAALREGERRITGQRIVVEFDSDGGWGRLAVEERVTMEDPRGTASGDRLEYEPETGVITMFGGPTVPASFSNSQGVDLRDPRGLRFEWTPEALEILALEQGTTQTVRRRGG